MKDTINMYYAKVENMGDILNREIIKKCFGYRVTRKSYLTGEISGIGSGLGNYTYEENRIKNLMKLITSPIFPKVYIWGTGFISYKASDTKFYKKQTKICAVRGELSKRRVEKILGKRISVPVGDAGILASFLLEVVPEKKYRVGIIAHFKEQGEPEFQKLLARFNNSVFIDVKKDPKDVIYEISQCHYIISSSLHGLIIADSLGIPNRHIIVTNNLLGDGFKFDDYYSAYGIVHDYTDMRKETIKSLDEIDDKYKVKRDMVEKKKKDMIFCFPYPSRKRVEV
ncbi:pyruvyl transferase [Lachnospiraceae bacterium PF1-21]|uniref:Polysaccharide pyruvyl transferase family protein n=1 Tax=Ohessyouella blattaphilus TaxID=2949333 RepID=A0ABT1EM04_9FIRM|nr:polysaccharide pyruvyl transferase family protein [Ohessyouella blattaphilus]MCP1111499.1 polysaccharide pyruvyl transferase family protein [Ohessyouella blattaphilus]MCR8564893.1 polysaccharide pyruvyl transferase family protein [Ohessyouella blattaphilus]